MVAGLGLLLGVVGDLGRPARDLRQGVGRRVEELLGIGTDLIKELLGVGPRSSTSFSVSARNAPTVAGISILASMSRSVSTSFSALERTWSTNLSASPRTSSTVGTSTLPTISRNCSTVGTCRPSGTSSMAGATFLAGAVRAVVAFLAAAFAGAVFFAAVLRAVVVAFFAATLSPRPSRSRSQEWCSHSWVSPLLVPSVASEAGPSSRPGGRVDLQQRLCPAAR